MRTSVTQTCGDRRPEHPQPELSGVVAVVTQGSREIFVPTKSFKHKTNEVYDEYAVPLFCLALMSLSFVAHAHMPDCHTAQTATAD